MYSELAQILKPEQLIFNEPLSRHTTFGIGGPVDVLVIPQSLDDITAVVAFCSAQNVNLLVLGLGSNLLVRDKGVRGVALKIAAGLDQVTISGEEIEAQAGISLSLLASKAADCSLSGMEFAEGIPGSLGGAVFMNAGAYGGEMKDIITTCTVLNMDGSTRTFVREEMNLAYRKSIFQDIPCVILSAHLHLHQGNREEIRQRMAEFSEQRRSKQPLEMPSAGSTFRRPEGFYVGPMIEQLGLKGYAIGGAQVSTKHAGFIVNRGRATAHDVLDLIAYIQEQASQRFGVDLHPEIKVVGEE